MVGMTIEDHRLVGCENRGVLHIAKALGMLFWGYELEKIDHIDKSYLEIRVPFVQCAKASSMERYGRWFCLSATMLWR